jgi:hypothetical protein
MHQRGINRKADALCLLSAEGDPGVVHPSIEISVEQPSEHINLQSFVQGPRNPHGCEAGKGAKGKPSANEFQSIHEDGVLATRGPSGERPARLGGQREISARRQISN